MEFSHSTSVAKIDARHSTTISEYLIPQNEPKETSQSAHKKSLETGPAKDKTININGNIIRPNYLHGNDHCVP